LTAELNHAAESNSHETAIKVIFAA